jgi:hypothetical protein
MNPLESFCVATSIAPGNVEIQTKAINSWLREGFHVVSINSGQEIEALSPIYPQVRFVESTRDARDKFAKPYIYFDDFLDFFKSSGYRRFGLINSDIVLAPLDDEGRNLIWKCTGHALLFGSRLNVESLDEPHDGTIFHMGYDFFFFDEHYLDLFPRSNFCIGLPWWDYWAVVVPILKGMPTHRMISQIALHQIHEVKWDPDVWHSLGDEFGQFMKPYLEFTDIYTLNTSTVACIEEKSSVQIARRFRTDAKVAVVLDRKDTTGDTPAIESLRRQTMPGVHILNANSPSLASELREYDYIYFMEEGDVIPPYFLEYMCSEIWDKAYVQCCFRILGAWGMDYTFRLRVDRNSPPNEKNFVRKSIVFSKEALLRNPNVIDDWTGEEGRFLGTALIERPFEEYVLQRVGSRSGAKLYLYGTGKHSKILLDLFKPHGIKVEGLFSPDADLHNTEFEGCPVYHDRYMTELDFDQVLISSYTFEKTIYDRISRVIPDYKILRLYFL